VKAKVKSAPTSSGIYEFIDESGMTIYVGKSINLRRRIRSYFFSKSVSSHPKTKKILKKAIDIRWIKTSTALEALLLENQLIQKLRPPINLAGKFWRTYPFWAIQQEGGMTHFAILTSLPEAAPPNLNLFGAFRSHQHTQESFHALCCMNRTIRI
jgi:excinuclease ABC subunit C